MLEPIPGPPGYPFLGNVLYVWDEVPINGLQSLADKYGPICKITVFGQDLVIVSNVKLIEELSDETRFHKVLAGGLERVKGVKASGLFTARGEDDPDWGQAHRILVPAFGPLAITDMFDEMHDIATQLVLKWARKGPECRVPATEDFTRLTLDTIALCAMDYRFNSFYQDEMHPFVQAMNRTLGAGNGPSTVFGIVRRLVESKPQSIAKDRALMEKIANHLVQCRRNNPSEKKDLLNAMINGKDPKTGEKMRDDLIISNMITFLIAGHETTSGLLSFAFANLLQNPASLQRAQAEVDEVVGQGKIRVNHLKKFRYLNAVLREALRLNPTVPAFLRQIRPENNEAQPSLGGYALDSKWKIVALISKSGKDSEVFGDDANEFHPERMLDGNFEKLPPSAWKPFGTGARSCIGRAFAWQEALLVMAIILQSFDVRLDDPHYQLRVKQTLTVKPRDFFIRASPRKGLDATTIQRSLSSSNEVPPTDGTHGRKGSSTVEGLTELLILFGSNTGTCQTLAQRLATDAGRFGYKGKVMDMDSGILNLQEAKNALIITASYEGQPPDDAVQFVEWVTSKARNLNLDFLQYAVFGCGHSDWAATFQKIPTLVDGKLAQAKGRRIVQRGYSDAAKGDISGDFDEWADHSFWPALTKLRGDLPTDGTAYGVPKLVMEIKNGDRASQLRQEVQEAVVTDARLLTAPGEPEKHHLEVMLPSKMAYEPGDYLAVLPLNPDISVQRVMTRYHIPWDATAIVKAPGATTFPTNTPISVTSLLKGYVELAQPATRKVLAQLPSLVKSNRPLMKPAQDIRKLASSAVDPSTQAALLSLAEQDYNSTVLSKRTSILDLLTHYRNISLSFPDLLSILPPMRPRHYSISSSPLANPDYCTITYSLIDSPTSLSNSGPFHGVAGSYLASLHPNDTLQVSIRPSSYKHFRLPPPTSQSPLLMFCAGTGLAPFRSFVQHRAELLKANDNLSLPPAILFIGCRSATSDRLYADDFDQWSAAGAVDVRYAFSREFGTDTRAKGCRYMQERIKLDGGDVWGLWERGAKVFVCGSGGVARAVGEAVGRVVRGGVGDKEGRGMPDGEWEDWWGRQEGERFVCDVFA